MSTMLRQFLDRGQVVLHLGAHKTATTSIQMALNGARADLQALGTALILPNDLRRGGAADQVDEHGDAPSLEMQLLTMAGDETVQRIVLSEENLIGSSGHNLARRSLYPNVTRRLRKLPAALDHPNVTVLFALRDYGPFLSSSATTAVRRGKVFDPETLRTAFLVLHRSWVDVVAEIRERFPAANLRIWRYEQFSQVETELWSELTDGFRPTFRKRAFQTLSRDAMTQVLSRLTNAAEPPRQIVRRAVRTFPISDTNPAYSLWTAQETALLSARYAAHWTEICDTYPDLVMESG